MAPALLPWKTISGLPGDTQSQNKDDLVPDLTFLLPPSAVGHGSTSTGKLSRKPDRNPRAEWRFCLSISPTTRALSQNLLITRKGSCLITLATANLGSRGKHPWKWVLRPQPCLGLEFFSFAPLLCLHPLEGTKCPLSSCALSFGLL